MAAFLAQHATIVFVVLALGWLALVIVLLVLLMLIGRWKTAFNEKDWTLVPTLQATHLTHALRVNAAQVARLHEVTERALEATQETRAEFGILGADLDKKSEEIRVLRMGQEFHHRKALMLAAVRALDAISIDAAADGDPQTTLRGIAVELAEALDDNHVETFAPQVGTLVPTRGADVGAARLVPTSDTTLVGTIASVERPAYIARGPNGTEEILKAASVSVYTTEENEQ